MVNAFLLQVKCVQINLMQPSSPLSNFDLYGIRAHYDDNHHHYRHHHHFCRQHHHHHHHYHALGAVNKSTNSFGVHLPVTHGEQDSTYTERTQLSIGTQRHSTRKAPDVDHFKSHPRVSQMQGMRLSLPEQMMTFDDRYSRAASSAPSASNAPYNVHRPFELAANSQFTIHNSQPRIV